MKKRTTIPIKLIQYAYHVENYSLREIGKLFGISGEAIRKRLEKSKSNEERK